MRADWHRNFLNDDGTGDVMEQGTVLCLTSMETRDVSVPKGRTENRTLFLSETENRPLFDRREPSPVRPSGKCEMEEG